MWQRLLKLNNIPFNSSSQFPSTLWVLGDARCSVLVFANSIFDKVERIAVSDLVSCEDGFVAFTEGVQTIEMAQSVLGQRRLPFVKLGDWESLDEFDDEWQALPSDEQVVELLEKILSHEKMDEHLSEAPVAVEKMVKVDVQRFLPYATVSFVCLAVVAIWYAVYYSDESELMQELPITAAAPIVEPVEQLPYVANVEQSSEVVIKCKWVVPSMELTAPLEGELLWNVADGIIVHPGFQIASIAIPADQKLMRAAQEFKQQLVDSAQLKQDEYQAAFQLQLLQLNQGIQTCEGEIADVLDELDSKSQHYALLRGDAQKGIRSWSELEPYWQDVVDAEQRLLDLKARLVTYTEQKSEIKSGERIFGDDELYLAQLRNADMFAKLVEQSPTSINVNSPQNGKLSHSVDSFSTVAKGQRLAEIHDFDAAYFVGSIRLVEHNESFRESDFFLITEGGARYTLHLHSENYNNGVFEYMFKIDVVRHSELSAELSEELFYDIIISPR
jgi:hypothetical protein